ncbi:MAG: GAF domain-containing protein [Chloroflexi bacterium]|nr:GAF domain-containing protein [Chloroflexota bacterium]MBI3339660.1 GAF domain-containing protein [Chloroflexota bacterium]
MNRHPIPPRGEPDSTRIIYQNWRQNFTGPMLIGALIFGALALVPAILSTQNYTLDGVFIVAYLALVAVTFIQFPYWLKMGIFLLMVYVLGLSELFSTGILGDGIFFFLAFIVITTMMFSPRAGMAATAISLITFGIMSWLTLSGRIVFLSPNVLPAKLTDWLSAAATTLLFGATIILGLRQLQIEFLEAQKQTANALNDLEKERGSLEERVEERTLQLKSVNEIGRTASSILNPQELVSRVVNLITDRFGYYYTAIFLLDEKGEWAELESATGEAGRILKENKHRLRVGGNSMVGAAINTKQLRVAQDVGAEPVRFENPLLPYTRSEIALPLNIGDRIVGALDVQSTQEAAFGPQEIETLQGAANQVAIAFENARLFASAEKNLAEMQAIQRQYVLNAWRPMSDRDDLQYSVGDDDELNDTLGLRVPITLRDEIIGHINLVGEGEWTPEQKGLVDAVATQAALALENARLVEGSQSSAAREHLLAEITGKVWSSTTIDAILQTAIREIGRAFDASEATIELKVEE